MTVESVRKQFERENLRLEVVEMNTSTATVELAANAIGVDPARIAKTMALRLKEKDIIIVAKGDVKIDNRKFKNFLHEKAKFINSGDSLETIGYPVGGVCPFGLNNPLEIYLDESLKVFYYVFPAGSGPNTYVKIDVDYLTKTTEGQWIDVCKE